MEVKQAIIERIKAMEDDCLMKENLYCQGMVEGLKIALHLIVKSEMEEKLVHISDTQIKNNTAGVSPKIH